MGVEININSREVFFDGYSCMISGRQWDILYELIKYETRSFRELKESIWNDVEMDDNILRSPLKKLLEIFGQYGYDNIIIKGRQRVSIRKEDIGIRTNFLKSSIVSAPLEIEDSYYFEHDSEYERLEEMLSQDNIAIVASEGGIGKTSLVEYYTRILSDKHNHTITWQDASDGLMNSILNIQWSIDEITQYQTAILKLRADVAAEEILGKNDTGNLDNTESLQNRKERIGELFSELLDTAGILGKCNRNTLVVFDNWIPSDSDYDILLRFKKVGANIILTTRMNDRFKMPPSLDRFLLTLKGFDFGKAVAVFNEIAGTDYGGSRLEELLRYCVTSQYGDRYLPLLVTLTAKIMKHTPFEKKEDFFQRLIESIKEGTFVTDTDTEFEYLKTVDGYRSSVFNVIDATYKYAIRDRNPLNRLVKQQLLINLSFFQTGIKKDKFLQSTVISSSPLHNTKKKKILLENIKSQMDIDIEKQRIHNPDCFFLDKEKNHLRFQNESYFDSFFDPLVVIRDESIHNISDEIVAAGKEQRKVIESCIEKLISFGYVKEYHKKGECFLVLHPLIASYVFEVCLRVDDVYDEALLMENINRQFYLIDFGKVLPLHHKVFIKMYRHCVRTNSNISDCIELLFRHYRTIWERDYLAMDDESVSVGDAEIEMIYDICNRKRLDIDIGLLCRTSFEYARSLGQCPLLNDNSNIIISNHWLNNAINLSKATYMRAVESLDEVGVIDSLKTIGSLYRLCNDSVNELIYDEELFEVLKRSSIASISDLAETTKFILAKAYKNNDTDKLRSYLCQTCANAELVAFLEEDWNIRKKEFACYYVDEEEKNMPIIQEFIRAGFASYFATAREKHKACQKLFIELISGCTCANGYFSIHRDELINKYQEQ